MQQQNKGAFILNGLLIGEEQTTKEAVEEFLENVMEMENVPTVISAHTIGQSAKAPTWFKLANPDQGAAIFQHVKKLKDKRNVLGKKYRLKEYVHEQAKQDKIREQDIRMQNFHLPAAYSMDMEYNKGDLMVNGEKYAKQIGTPTIKDGLLLSREQEILLDKVQLHEGQSRAENGSNFQVYIKDVNNLEEVQSAYQAVHKNHMSATHIMCAYRIFGNKFHVLQDFCDDGEHGGGRACLGALKEIKVWNIVVFMVRYHAGPNLGKRRFDIMTEMVKQGVATFPKSLNYGQYFQDQLVLDALNKATEKPMLQREQQTNRRANGRDPGRRGRSAFRGRAKTGREKKK